MQNKIVFLFLYKNNEAETVRKHFFVNFHYFAEIAFKKIIKLGSSGKLTDGHYSALPLPLFFYDEIFFYNVIIFLFVK